MDTVVITNASTYVGRNLATHLLDEGYELRLLTSEPAAVQHLGTRGAEIQATDQLDDGELRDLFDNVDGLFHIATTCRPDDDFANMLASYVDGTRRIIDAAIDADVSRIVYAGSDIAFGDTGRRVCDESKTHDGPFHSPYERASWEAHRIIEHHIDNGAPIIDTPVSTVYGTDRGQLVAALIEHHLAHRAVAHVAADTGHSFLHVDDAVRGLRLAYEDGATGERYLLSGTPTTIGNLLEQLSTKTGIPAPRMELPDGLVDHLEKLLRRIGTLPAEERPDTETSLLASRDINRLFSNRKAREQLQWTPRPLDEGLDDILPWFQRREYEASRRLLESAKMPLVGLTLFDIGLGISALVFPGLYRAIMHPRAGDTDRRQSSSLLARTGLLWLFFAFVQGGASVDPVERPEWVMVTGALRLMDVPADIGYLLSADDLGWLGKAGLIAAPVFNLGIGTFLAYAGYRGLRAKNG